MTSADAGKWRYQLFREALGTPSRRFSFLLAIPDVQASRSSGPDLLSFADVTNDNVDGLARTMSIGTVSVTLDPSTTRDEKFLDPHGTIDATLECSNLPAPAAPVRVTIDS